MEIKFVIPDMKETFGNLEYGGIGTAVQVRTIGQAPVIARKYHLFSDVQRAEDIIVYLPDHVGEKKNIEPETPVTLVNPRLSVEGYKIGDRGLSKYLLLADDIIKKESEDKKI